jgi:hypothetical protein
MRRLAVASVFVVAVLVLFVLPGALAARFRAPVTTSDFLVSSRYFRYSIFQSVAPIFTIEFAHNDYLK